MSEKPSNADVVLTNNSGIDVPPAITVIAMNLSETPKILASSEAELTKSRPPIISPARPLSFRSNSQNNPPVDS